MKNVIFILLVLVSCKKMGTNEGSIYQIVEPLQAGESVTFEMLTQKVLKPYSCTRCHRSMRSKDKFQMFIEKGDAENSFLYQMVEGGEMPPRGDVLDSVALEYVAAYINGLVAQDED